MITGRELFTQFLKGEPLSRPCYVPLVRGLMARIEGMTLEALTSDPTLWANSLVKAAELFDFDGVVAGFDFSLMAEACGCKIVWRDDRPVVQAPPSGICENPEESGRIKHALEAARRVFQVCRDRRFCVAALTGPVTLAHQLFGRLEGPKRVGDVKHLVVRVAEAFLKTRPDTLVFMEGRPLATVDRSHQRLYQTLKNIAAYYNIPVSLYVQGYPSRNLSQFASLKMDIYILGPSEDKSLPPLSELWNLSSNALGVGLGLPVDDLSKARALIREGLDLYRAQGGRRGFFFTSFGPVNRDADLETLHQLIKEISQTRL
jgi:hypothetical protein